VGIFKKLSPLLSKHDKKFLLFLLIFSIFISVIETIGISVVMPFVALAGDFSMVHTVKYYQYLYDLLSFKDELTFVMVFGFILILFYFFRSMVNLLYQYLLSKFAKGRYYLIAYRLFKNYLGMPYRAFVERNSSELTKTVISEAHNLTNLISSLLIIVSELFIILLIYSILTYVNWKVTLFLTVVLALNTLIMVKTVSKKMRKIGDMRAFHERSFFEIISTVFRNFKIIKLYGREDRILEEFSYTGKRFANTYIVSDTFAAMPKLFLEALGFSVVIAVIIYLIYQNQTDISHHLGVLSIFVLGLYRLIPSFHRVLANYNNIQFNLKSLDIVHNDLIYEVEDLGNKNIIFSDTIRLKDVDFSYVEGKQVLKSINIDIKKGSKIAFTGESGGGKSTLVDIISGLYRPKSGYIYIDDQMLDESNIREWRKKIGYIPQSIYLFDGTVAENIAMSSDIDKEKIIYTLKQANIWDFLKREDGIDTEVGDAGVKLSGGQRQRIAIARALYHDPEILILDEATSALDNETEKRIMDEIYRVSEGKTLIIIAHRLSTIERCDRIFIVQNAEIKETGCKDL